MCEKTSMSIKQRGVGWLGLTSCGGSKWDCRSHGEKCAHLLLPKASAGASGSGLHWQPGGKGCTCSLPPCVSGSSNETVVSEGGIPQLGVLLFSHCLEAVDSCLPAERSNPAVSYRWTVVATTPP